VTTRSLRLRLFVAAVLAILAALTVSGGVLARLFAVHVEAREYAELENHQNQIAAALELGPNREVRLTAQPADPRFGTPHGGLYWQIDLGAGAKIRSRSLWETELLLPPDDVPDGILHRHDITGPNGSALLAVERALTIGPDGSTVPLRLTVAVDRRDLLSATAGFHSVLIKSLGVLGLALLGASLLQIHVGLQPLRRLRSALRDVHQGAAEHVTGNFAQEVEPLVDDLNTLLDQERLNQQRARERAADLAHGFKTPLAVLAAVSRDLGRDGRSQAAAEIDAQIDVMGRHTKRELARARTVGSVSFGQQTVLVRSVIAKVETALRRIAADRQLTWTIDASGSLVFDGDENDLLELVGNLADNASKWARSRVVLRAARETHSLTLTVEDDGPGLPDGTEQDSLTRGTRLDETTASASRLCAKLSKPTAAHWTYNDHRSAGCAPLPVCRTRTGRIW
jgi:signal transduction histidine kinase